MERFLNALVDELAKHPVNENPFFCDFRHKRLTRAQLRNWLSQYHYFCKHFVKVLEGLLYRTPVDALEMRVELAKTLHSELGSGCIEQAHVRLLERFAAAVGFTAEELARTVPIPEVAEYLAELDRLFVGSDYLTALGSELAVEVTAGAEFRYFYPGLQKYQDFSEDDLEFFELHLELEDSHSAWLVEAVRKTARDHSDLERVAAGARATVEAWSLFWQGIYREVFGARVTAAH
jgi:pyrroloquinoline-quinone synthase